MNFRFLISTTFAILSVALLMDERKEMSLKNLVELTTEIVNKEFWDPTHYSDRLLVTKKSFSEYPVDAIYIDRRADRLFEIIKKPRFSRSQILI